MSEELREKLTEWLNEKNYDYKFLDYPGSVYVSKSKNIVGVLIPYYIFELSDVSFENVVDTYWNKFCTWEKINIEEEDEEDEEDDELYKEISEWVDSARYSDIPDRIYNAESSVIELEERWNRLKDYVEKLFVDGKTSVGFQSYAVGNILQYMNELEGEDE